MIMLRLFEPNIALEAGIDGLRDNKKINNKK